MIRILKSLLKFFIIFVICIAAFVLIAFVYYKIINTNSGLRQNYLNITYKNVGSDELKLDIYMPKRQLFPKIPILIHYHGGGWEVGSKKLSASDFEVFNIFMEAGFALISVDYRLTDENNKFPAHFEDAADSIRWLVKNADAYGLDGNRINLLGASAGGQMALLMGIKGNSFKGSPELADVSFNIRSIIDLCGPTDFTDLSDFDPARSDELDALLLNFFGGTYDQMKDRYEIASPIFHVNKNSPPIFISHGQLDDVVPIEQAEKFYQKALSVNANVTFVPVENANHKFKAPDNGITKPLVKDVLFDMAIFLLKNNIF